MPRSQSQTRSSSSVTAGPVRQSMALTLRAAARVSPTIAGGGAGDGEVGEEAGVVPVGDVGLDQGAVVVEDAVHRLGVRGRLGGEGAGDVAGPDGREDGVAGGACEEVVGGEVGGAVEGGAQLVGGEVALRAGGHRAEIIPAGGRRVTGGSDEGADADDARERTADRAGGRAGAPCGDRRAPGGLRGGWRPPALSARRGGGGLRRELPCARPELPSRSAHPAGCAVPSDCVRKPRDCRYSPRDGWEEGFSDQAAPLREDRSSSPPEGDGGTPASTGLATSRVRPVRETASSSLPTIQISSGLWKAPQKGGRGGIGALLVRWPSSHRQSGSFPLPEVVDRGGLDDRHRPASRSPGAARGRRRG